jgi:hypothetical protein
MTAGTPHLFAGQQITIGIVNTRSPIALCPDYGIVYTVIVTARAVATIAHAGVGECLTIGKQYGLLLIADFMTVYAIQSTSRVS